MLLQPPASLSTDELAMFLTAEMRSVRVLHYEHNARPVRDAALDYH